MGTKTLGNRSKVHGRLVQFFEEWHLNEVIVVASSYFIIHLKKYDFMEMVKTVSLHLIISICLTELATWFAFMVAVGFNGK